MIGLTEEIACFVDTSVLRSKNQNKLMKAPISRCIQVLRFLLPRMWYIEGKEITTGEKLGFIWCGPERQQAYMTTRIFGAGAVTTEYIGRRPIMYLERLQESFDCSLAILAGPQHVLDWFSQADDICVPWWVDAELDIDVLERTRGRPKSLRDDLRRVRKNALSYHIKRTFGDYKFFYNNIYLPTITGSHGSAALPSSFDRRWAEIAAGRVEMMFITMNGEPVGGLLLDYRNEVPGLRDIGIINGNKKTLKTGVITAANYFAMQHLKEKGYKKVCLGLSRSFLDDGVLIYKQKWKPTLIDISSEVFLFRVSHLSSATRSLLRSSSFIAGKQGDFRFAFFAANDGDVRENRTQLEKLSSIYGINAASMIDVSGERPEMRRAS